MPFEMTPEVIERVLAALEIRREVPTPSWSAIAARVGCAQSTLIECVERYYKHRDRHIAIATLVEDHNIRREHAWRLTTIAVASAEPHQRAALISELWRQLELEARELGLLSSPAAGPITLINNTSQASSNAIAGTTGGTLDDIRAVLGEILMAERSDGGVPLPPMNGNGNGNGHIADAESAPDEDATQ